MVAGIIGLWVYAFFFAPSGNPDRIENENWIQKAEAICFQAKNELTLLPSATKAENPSDRAQVLEDGRKSKGHQAGSGKLWRRIKYRHSKTAEDTDQ